MHLVEVIIDDNHYTVSNEFAESLKALCKEADVLTGLAYPDIIGAYPLYLTAVGDRVIAAIKAYRFAVPTTLREAKAAIDRVRAGKRVLIGKFPYHEGIKFGDYLREAGASVEFPSALEMLAQEGE